MGQTLSFGPLTYVPTSVEAELLEHAVELLNPGTPLTSAERAREAGRLHYQNFAATPYGRLLARAMPNDFKQLMLRARFVARHVFRNMQFSSEDLGGPGVAVEMRNSGYPPEHFAGLFEEWMRTFGLAQPSVMLRVQKDDTHRYELRWNDTT